jgi:hypothetical protein
MYDDDADGSYHTAGDEDSLGDSSRRYDSDYSDRNRENSRVGRRRESRNTRSYEPASPLLFSGVILQSNPLGYKYRTVAVANFIGAGFKQNLDCEDLECLQSESTDEILHVQVTPLPHPASPCLTS